MTRRFAPWLLVLAVGAACSATGSGTGPGLTPGSGGSGNTGTAGTSPLAGRGGGIGVSGTGGSITVTPGKGEPGLAPPRLCEVCNDFPAAPIVVEGTPASAPNQFTSTGSGAGPCVAEPADGTLFPNNWLRPRIRWTGNSSVYEVRVHTARQANDLVVY